jgi:hypothetical protein
LRDSAGLAPASPLSLPIRGKRHPDQIFNLGIIVNTHPKKVNDKQRDFRKTRFQSLFFKMKNVNKPKKPPGTLGWYAENVDEGGEVHVKDQQAR